MTKFYATATDSKGKNFIIHHNETFTTRINARIEAERQCKAQGLTLNGVYPVGRQETNSNVLTKYAKARKQLKK